MFIIRIKGDEMWKRAKNCVYKLYDSHYNEKVKWRTMRNGLGSTQCMKLEMYEVFYYKKTYLEEQDVDGML